MANPSRAVPNFLQKNMLDSPPSEKDYDDQSPPSSSLNDKSPPADYMYSTQKSYKTVNAMGIDGDVESESFHNS